MEDIRKMIPHHKKEAKLDSKDDLRTINEIADVKACNSTVFFEVRNLRLNSWSLLIAGAGSQAARSLHVAVEDSVRTIGEVPRCER